MAVAYTRGYSPKDLMTKLFARKEALDGRLAEVARQGAEDIKDLSVDNSPVDDGELEAAHKVVARDTRRGNAAFDITVGGYVNGVDTDLYATWIHDGDYKLGPLSLAKAATGKNVGRKYLERAFLELKPEIVANYKTLLNQTFGT